MNIPGVEKRDQISAARIGEYLDACLYPADEVPNPSPVANAGAVASFPYRLTHLAAAAGGDKELPVLLVRNPRGRFKEDRAGFVAGLSQRRADAKGLLQQFPADFCVQHSVIPGLKLRLRHFCQIEGERFEHTVLHCFQTHPLPAQTLFRLDLFRYIDGIALYAEHIAAAVANGSHGNLLPYETAFINETHRAFRTFPAAVDGGNHLPVGFGVLSGGVRVGEEIIRVMIPHGGQLCKAAVQHMVFTERAARVIGEELKVRVLHGLLQITAVLFQLFLCPLLLVKTAERSVIILDAVLHIGGAKADTGPVKFAVAPFNAVGSISCRFAAFHAVKFVYEKLTVGCEDKLQHAGTCVIPDRFTIVVVYLHKTVISKIQAEICVFLMQDGDSAGDSADQANIIIGCPDLFLQHLFVGHIPADAVQSNDLSSRIVNRVFPCFNQALFPIEVGQPFQDAGYGFVAFQHSSVVGAVFFGDILRENHKVRLSWQFRGGRKSCHPCEGFGSSLIDQASVLDEDVLVAVVHYFAERYIDERFRLKIF